MDGWINEHLISWHTWMDRRSWQHTCMDGRMDERLVSWDTHPMDGWMGGYNTQAWTDG